jgi:hypothetical protein
VGAFELPRTIIHEYADTGIDIIILIADADQARQKEIYEGLIANLAWQYGYRLVVYDFNKANELIVVLQEEEIL